MRRVSSAAVSVVTIEPGASPVTEGTAVQFTVQAIPAPTDELLVNIQVTDAGARLAASPPRTVTVPAGATAAMLRQETDADEEDEADSTVTATVTEGAGYTLGTPSSAQVTVTDAAAPVPVPVPVVTIAASLSSVSEGAELVFTVMADPAPAADLVVAVAVTETAAMLEQPGPRTVTIPTGAPAAMLAVATDADEKDEPDSTVTATLTEGSGYTLGSGMSSASVLVIDADEPLPVVTIQAAASEVTEGTPVRFTVSADRTLGVELPVNVTVSENLSMLAGPTPRSVTIQAGAGAATLTVNTDDDSVAESFSTVTAELTSGTGYEIGVPSSAAVRVVDNDGTPGGDGRPGPVPLFFNLAVEIGADLVINGKNDSTVGAVGQCAEIGMSAVPRRYWAIGGVPAISYDIWLQGTVEDDAGTVNVDESAAIVIGPDRDMISPDPTGMASLADRTAVVNGMHGYKVVAADDNLVVSGIADMKTTAAISLAVNLRASDSHDPIQRAELGLMRNVNITRHAIDHAVQGTTGLDEDLHDDTAFRSERTYSAGDFPSRPGAPNELLTLGFPTDAMAYAVTGKIHGALDEDWFLLRGVAPDYLIHLQIVGNAAFVMIPANLAVAFADEEDDKEAMQYVLSSHLPVLADFDEAYHSLRCGDYYVRVTGRDEAAYILGWRVDVDRNAD